MRGGDNVTKLRFILVLVVASLSAYALAALALGGAIGGLGMSDGGGF